MLQFCRIPWSKPESYKGSCLYTSMLYIQYYVLCSVEVECYCYVLYSGIQNQSYIVI